MLSFLSFTTPPFFHLFRHNRKPSTRYLLQRNFYRQFFARVKVYDLISQREARDENSQGIDEFAIYSFAAGDRMTGLYAVQWIGAYNASVLQKASEMTSLGIEIGAKTHDSTDAEGRNVADELSGAYRAPPMSGIYQQAGSFCSADDEYRMRACAIRRCRGGANLLRWE